jgi:hypothetical protein
MPSHGTVLLVKDKIINRTIDPFSNRHACAGKVQFLDGPGIHRPPGDGNPVTEHLLQSFPLSRGSLRTMLLEYAH